VLDGIGELIARLNDSSGDGEDAKFELIARGIDIIPELAARLEDLERFGKLSAIEAFEALQDPRACPALIGLLADEDETVVEWAAGTLGSLRCRDSVAPLKSVLSRMIDEQVPPDWTGPVQVRSALAELGARTPVLPSVTMSLRQRHDDTEMWLCRSSDLAAVVDDLAEHSQVVLGFTLWRIGDDEHLYWTQHESEAWSFDWSARWADNVAAAWEGAQRDVATLPPNTRLLAHVTWIDETDVTPFAASGPSEDATHR
jgi:hypothetical protein